MVTFGKRSQPKQNGISPLFFDGIVPVQYKLLPCQDQHGWDLASFFEKFANSCRLKCFVLVDDTTWYKILLNKPSAAAAATLFIGPPYWTVDN